MESMGGFSVTTASQLGASRKENTNILRENHMSEIKEKNELDYTCGLSDDELTQRFIESIRIDEEIRKIKGLPTSGYDADLKKAYLLYPDGRKEYV